MRTTSISPATVLSALQAPRLRRATRVTLAFAGGLGCVSSQASPGDAGTQAEGDSGAASHEGGSGGGSSSGDAAGGTTTAGVVGFYTGGTGSLGSPNQFVGAFDQGSGHLTGSSPCDQPVGACTYCGGTDAGPSGGNLMIAFVSAGVLTLTDGTTKIGTLPYMGDDAGMGDYTSDQSTNAALVWAAGDTLSVSATGSPVIPAFSASIKAPQDIAGVNPGLSLAAPAVAVSTSKPFVLSWTPSSDGGQMELVLGGFSGGGTASCRASESDGSLTVPASILQKFGSGGGTLGFSKTVSKPVSVPGVTMLIQALAPQLTASVTFGP